MVSMLRHPFRHSPISEYVDTLVGLIAHSPFSPIHPYPEDEANHPTTRRGTQSLPCTVDAPVLQSDTGFHPSIHGALTVLHPTIESPCPLTSAR